MREGTWEEKGGLSRLSLSVVLLTLIDEQFLFVYYSLLEINFADHTADDTKIKRPKVTD